MVNRDWFKSTHSGGDNTCVEVAFIDDHAWMRDTKDKGNGPTLVFTAAEWRSFIDGCKAGEFDLEQVSELTRQ